MNTRKVQNRKFDDTQGLDYQYMTGLDLFRDVEEFRKTYPKVFEVLKSCWL